MVVFLMIVNIHLYESTSLKMKRQLRLSLKDHLKTHFNISIIESDYQDDLKRIQLSLASVLLNESQIQNLIDQLTNAIYLKTDRFNAHVEITSETF